MDIKQLVAGLKEKGLTDEQVKEELLKIKTDIDAFLNPAPATDKPAENKKEESDAEKEQRIFGNI